MTSSILPAGVLIVLPLLSSVTSANTNSREGCDTHAAMDCMTYSEKFQKLPEEEQHSECGNAQKTVDCLEAMVARCPSMETEDNVLYTMITRQVASFKAETVQMCAACSLTTSTMMVMTSVFLSIGLLRLLFVTSP